MYYVTGYGYESEGGKHMKTRARFIALGNDSGNTRFDQLPWPNRLWQAFHLGVSRKLDRLSGPRALR